MKLKKFIYALLFLSYPLGLLANAESNETTFEFNVEKLNEERNILNYDLNQIIDTLQRCINSNNKICIPENLTEYERLLFTARRIQHNDSQFVAIEIFNYLLEFEWYRSRGEELYLKLLLANSLDYVGASYLASEYMDEIFPEFLKYVEKDDHKRFFLNHYANRLINIDKIEEAHHTYQIIYDLSINSKDSGVLYTAKNNLGLTYSMLGENSLAKKLFRQNQNEVYKNINPVLYAFSFGNYGTIMKNESKYDSAIYYGKKEVQILNSINSKIGLSNTFHMIGECFEKLDKNDSAIVYFNKALLLRLNNANIEGIVITARELIELNTAKNKSEEIEYLFNLFDTYSDSLAEKNHNKQSKDELQIYNYLEILDEAQLSKQKFDELTIENRELNYSLIALIVFSILLILFLVNRRKYRLKLESANKLLTGKNIELEKSNSELIESNKRNETLLKELHHRVKNNLQIVSSLFNLQINDAAISNESKEVFQVAKNRILSISMLHKKLYLADNLSKINFKEYLEEFGYHFTSNQNEEIELLINISDSKLNFHIDAALPLGLIFNELFTNSVKHANATGKLILSIDHIQKQENDLFIYKDNGTSEAVLQNNELSDSTGMILIDLLAKQLESKYQINPEQNHEGFVFSIEGNFRKNIN